MNDIVTRSLTLRPEDFADFFLQATGRSPYPWQEQLARRVVETGHWPEAIVAPTGAGKSSVVDVHLFAVAVTHAPAWEGPRVPRRLWHVVGRRALVDDMADHAQELVERLQSALREEPDSVVGRVAAGLAALSPQGDEVGLVTSLRGGIAPQRGWQDDPLSCQVVCATPDMAGSRLLFRGYGSSRGMRPREAGLLAHDAVMVVDEAHLNRQLLTTARRVAGLAGESPLAAYVPTLQVVETTATPTGAPDDALGVALKDIRDGSAGAELIRRLDRPKPVHLHTDGPWLSGRTAKQLRQGAEDVAALVREALDAGQAPVGVVLNRVASALAVHSALETGPDSPALSLLVGPRRRWEQAHDRAEEQHPQVYVATQSVEVGVDLDFGCLITDLAPGASLAQRAGRLNRTGARETAPVHVLCPSDGATTDASAAPYDSGELTEALRWLEGRAEDPAGLAPSAVLADPPPSAAADRLHLSVIEPARAALFSRTDEDLVVEPDLTLWLRDSLDPETDVAVIGRRLPRLGDDAEVRDVVDEAEAVALLAAAPPQPHEAMPCGISRLRRMAFPRRGEAVPVFVRRGDAWVRADADDPERRLRPGDVAVVPHDWHAVQRQVLLEEGTEEVGDVLDPRDGHGTMLPRHSGREGAARHLAVVTGLPLTGGADRPRCASLLEVCADLQDAGEDVELGSLRDALVDRGQWTVWERLLGSWADHSEDGGRRVDILVGGRAPEAPGQASWAVLVLRDTRSSDDAQLSVTTSGAPVTLADHQRDVAERAESLARRLGLPEALSAILHTAGLHHDDGKADERFQAWLCQGMEERTEEPLAKSVLAHLPLRQRSFLPSGWRHEQLSAAMLRATRPDADALALRLVGTSHGHGRGLFSMPARRLLPRDATPTLRAAAEDLFDVGEWDALCLAVEQEWGLWGTAWLEAVLRSADVTVSQEGR